MMDSSLIKDAVALEHSPLPLATLNERLRLRVEKIRLRDSDLEGQIAKKTANIMHIQDQVKELQRLASLERTAIDSMTAERTALEEERLVTYACLAPKLPSDLFAVIFEAVVADWEQSWGRNLVWSMLRYLLTTLSLVSKAWRTIVLNTPRLWRNILVENPEYGRDVHGAWVARNGLPSRYYSYKLCVKRSGVVPLNVWVKGQESAFMLFRLLSDFSPRRRFHRVQMEECNQLRQGVHGLPWVVCQNVAHLSLRNMHLTRDLFIILLGSNEALESMQLTSFTVHSLHESRSPTIPELKNLRRIEHLQTISQLGDTLSCFRSPQLYSITVTLSLHVGNSDLHDRMHMAQVGSLATFGSVQEVNLQGQTTLNDILCFLLFWPSVQILHLQLKFFAGYDGLFSAMAEQTSPGSLPEVDCPLEPLHRAALLPRLRELHIHIYFHAVVLSCEPLRQLAEARRGVLTEVYLELSTIIGLQSQPADFKILQECVNLIHEKHVPPQT